MGTVRRMYNQLVSARDGVALATDVYLPPGDGPFPAVLGRTPYNKNNPGYAKLIDAWNRRGYALVIQDCRGRGDSDGVFTPYRDDGRDGCDTVEWVAARDWCDGNVTTQGASYGGRISWLTALEHPPHLRAMIVAVCPSDPFVEFPTSGESLMGISWFRLVDRHLMQRVDDVDWMEVYTHLPLETLDAAAGFSSPHWRSAMAHTYRDEHWGELRYQHRFAELDLPVLHISGWYDDEQIGTPLNFAGMVGNAASQRARNSQRLVMGPWGHQINSTQKLGEVDFGPGAVVDLEGGEADWLDGVLGRGAPSETAPVRLFVMGANTWRDEYEWPLARTRFTDYFLHSGGRANSRYGDGMLSTSAPGANEPADTYTYDPSRPVPFMTVPSSAQIGGPDDYSAVEQRGDVLCYTTEVLGADVEVTGPVRLRLFASSSAVDTDFTAKLVDVHPGGFCQRLCDSVIRARFREGVDRQVLMDPGTVYEFDIDMWNTSQVFMAGHRIRLEVSSSAFPKYDRNLNTGEDIGRGVRMEIAENRAWHEVERPSRLILPIVPKDAN
ncbi:MAG: CocE/NonD family hydrolase [Candidatus Dormibacteria bacterium]